MSKKVWLVLLAVVLVFGLSVIGCGGGDDGGGGGGGSGANTADLYDAGWVVDGTPFTYSVTSITIEDNFTYGASWQKKIPWADLLNKEIKKDDVYELEIAFTVSRALDKKLQWVLVNDDASVDYWKELSNWQPVINGSAEDFDPGTNDANVPVFTATDNVSYKGRTLAKLAAPAGQAKLALDTAADDNSGGAPVLTVSKFKITKLKWDAASSGSK